MKILRWIERIAHSIGLLLAIVAIVWIGVIIGRPAEKGGNQANFSGAEQQKKRLAVFLDGTWNSVNSNTNVWRMRALCATKSRDGEPQLVYYEIGVNGFLGGVFGHGLDENIRLAYEWLVENYNDGDEIFIFGFSRGAFTARALAGLVAIDGILKAGSPIGVTELFERYKKGNEESIWQLKEVQASGDTSKLTEQERWLLKYSQPVDVKVIGVWDTVGSVGVAAGNIPGISRSQFDYLQTGLRIHILNGYHALAVDEHRPDFTPTIWDVRQRMEDINVLSVGTTTSKFSLPSSLGRDFGQKLWLENGRLLSTILSSQQQLVDFMLKHQLGDRYVRFDAQPSPEQTTDLGLDLATANRRQTLLGMADGCYQALSNNPKVIEMLAYRRPQPTFHH